MESVVAVLVLTALVYFTFCYSTWSSFTLVIVILASVVGTMASLDLANPTQPNLTNLT